MKKIYTNYKKGRRREQYIKEKYKKLGCICVRSAGSRSPFDLICVHPRKRRIIFIQCKPRKFSQKSKERLVKKFAWLNDEFMVNFEVE